MNESAFVQIWIQQFKVFLEEVVPETGYKPGPDNWHLIAFEVARKYAPQLKSPAPRGRPAMSGSDRLQKHWGGLADVVHYKYLHKSTLKEAVEHSLFSWSNFKEVRKNNRLWWDMLMERPDVAEVMATDENRRAETSAFKQKKNN